MLNGINKLLTGDMLKILCDMGHGDELVIADANFPAETCANRLIRLPRIDGVKAVQAIVSVFPLDTYTSLGLITAKLRHTSEVTAHTSVINLNLQKRLRLLLRLLLALLRPARAV